jgi:serine/threonine-protein kinase ULK4
VLLNEFGMLKLCDFGLAKKIVDLSQPDNESHKPKSGTPYYMAPELFQDGGVYSFASDFWSLGCVLYELATGKPPFSASGLKELIAEILESDFEKVNAFGSSFHDLLTKLLEKDPLRRISWEQLRKHPFWNEELPKRALPNQPQFDIYVKSKGYDPEEFYKKQEKNSYFELLH